MKTAHTAAVAAKFHFTLAGSKLTEISANDAD